MRRLGILWCTWCAAAVLVCPSVSRGGLLFEARQNLLTGDGPWSVAVGHLDGDGELDLVTANFGENYISVLLGNGDGTFQERVDYYTDPMSQPIGVAIGDLDRDGDDDAVREPGRHTASWDGRDEAGRDAASRVYFCRVKAEGKAQTERMVLIR
jgi:hypothetical protein